MNKYTELQKAWLNIYPLKPGNIVEVTRIAKDYEAGWGFPWVSMMDQYVGKEMVVKSISEENGIGVDNPNINDGPKIYWFPVTVLIAKQYKAEKFKISKDYEAEIQKDGSVVVGCQTVPYGLLKRIYDAATKQVH